jgi:hypothetical protein
MYTYLPIRPTYLIDFLVIIPLISVLAHRVEQTWLSSSLLISLSTWVGKFLAGLGAIVLLIGIALVRESLVRFLSWHAYGSKYPPGPIGLPFLGNALQIPGDRQWVKFEEWRQKYGQWRVLCSYGD